MTTLVFPPTFTAYEDGPATPARSARAGRARERIAFAALLVGSALLYLVNLSVSGWANQFYAAAAQAGSKSWTAFLFGSLDASNFITVDKPPASLWVMDLSVRIFGVNSWAILVPQALEGVAAVALLYAAVRRVAGPNAGLLAGAILATTPVAALMFRFDNPDALLVLLMTAAAYATLRAVEAARARWLVLAGGLLGLAFLTKMLQGFLVVPAFAVAYLVAAPSSWRRRLVHLAAAGAAMVASCGWWIALVELWPSGSRPYVGGSNHDSILELVLGYNGVGRLTGADNNGNVSGGTGGFSSGDTGLTRLFGSDMGSQISWLLPAALLGIVALAWLSWRSPRTDRLRAALIVFGGWLLVTGVVFSFASGIIHPYYTVALAPAIAATVALAVVSLWRSGTDVARWTLGALLLTASLWTFVLLGRASWQPDLRWIVLLAGTAAAVLACVPRMRAWLLVPFASVALLLGPTAYAIQTASTAHTGALPTAGPSTTADSRGRPGGGGFGTGPGGGSLGGSAGGGFGGPPAGSGAKSMPTGTGTGTPSAPSFSGGGGSGGSAGGAAAGGAGGLGGATTVSSSLKAALTSDASAYEWVAATTSDNEAASLELATGRSVMALGGYNGTDPAISLTAFEKLVREGKVHYYVADSQGFIGSTAADTSTAYAIEQWVEQHYSATTVGGTTVYDLTIAHSTS